MKKQNKILLSIALAATVICLILVVLRENGFISGNSGILPSNAFAVADTSTVTKIFLANQNLQLLLTKNEAGEWLVNQKYPVQQDNLNLLLSTMKNLTILQIVPEKAWSNINKTMITGSTKVEIYQKIPKFTIFGVPFGVKERLTKLYYMGTETQDNQSNFALLDGVKEPYVVYLPGFRGFVSPRYSAVEDDWRSHLTFNTKITRIQEILFEDVEEPKNTFRVVKNGIRMFDVYDYQDQKLPAYDTTKLVDMLSEFRRKNYERCIENMDAQKKDSVLQRHFKTITLTDADGNVFTLKAYRILETSEDDPMESMNLIFSMDNKYNREINRDKFYGIFNDNPKEMLLCQYFVFDRILQPLSYFLDETPVR